MASKRILVVDDEPAIREVAALSLQAVGGYDVLTAESGSDCVRQAAEQHPDAILLDVMMPEMDGPTTFATLQSDTATCDIPVILLTAKVQAADHLQFAELGVAAVLPKPFDPMTLPGQVAGVLGWPG